MSITRQWLDWAEPCLPAAAQWLMTQSGGDERICALDHLVCVTSGKRAGRLLIEQLLRVCDDRGLHLVPPRTITPGLIVDALANGGSEPAATATAAECVFAWAAAMQSADPATLSPLIATPPSPDDLLAWHDLAETISRLHDELAGDRLRFENAADEAERMEFFGEGERWRALQTLHGEYARKLTECSLVDRHEAGEQALADGQTNGDTRLVLIGIVELNAMQREAVSQLTDPQASDGEPTVTALIHAPQAFADRFDAMGCVIPEAWAEVEIELDEEQIIIADRPDDQAQAAIRSIASFDGRYAADEITIGLGDAALGEVTHHAAAWAELTVHRGDGIALPRTLPYRLLDAAANWLNGRRFADFAALLRHPDLDRWLHDRARDRDNGDGTSRGIADWLSLLDKYFSEHLHERLTGSWLGEQRQLRDVYNDVQQLLKPLAAGTSQPLGSWSEPALVVLRSVYGERADIPHESREACLALRDVLVSQSSIDSRLQPETDAATALRLSLRGAAKEMIAQQPRQDQVDMLGWLELHMDPGPALVLMGVNDGQVPESITADAFLPDALRSRLGLVKNNARRYARDAYLLQAIRHSREKLVIITGRRAADGEPLAPSRLLLACEANALPHRVDLLCEEKHARRWPVPAGAPATREQCLFIGPPTPPATPPTLERMSVTSFRGYLACPYRYWLGHIERLRTIGDDADELDPLNFGSFAHNALERFGKDESVRGSADPEAIAAVLTEHVDALALSTFGKRPPPAVRVQLARLKLRMIEFARCQAELRTHGWIIQETEYVLPEQTYLEIPGEEPMRITGKIDRIDRNETTGAYRLIDYKTSESGATPFEVHHGTKKYKEDCWLDLQLPLYHHLAAQHGFDGEVEVGYIVLPKRAEDVAFLPGPWTDEQFEAAIDKAREVVMDIRAGCFEANPDYPAMFDDYANICQSNILGGDDAEGDDA